MNTYILDPLNFADPAAPTVEELEAAKHDISCAVVSSDFTWGAGVIVEDAEPLASNYTADLSFDLGYVISHEQMRRNILGRWFEYTPADELRDRLNRWLKGKQPEFAINTRYWRGL